MGIPASSKRTLLTTTQAAEYLGVASHTLARWRVAGRGPRYAKLGAVVRYETQELDRWIAEQTRTSTADEGPGQGEER